jgi:tRNA(fMet)-specific endonuclease VapC
VLSELYFAAYASQRQRQNLQNINLLLEHIPVLDFDLAAAEEYGHIKAELKTKGRPIPGTDAQIAAVARLYDLIVLSTDRHFQYVDNLQVESWL